MGFGLFEAAARDFSCHDPATRGGRGPGHPPSSSRSPGPDAGSTWAGGSSALLSHTIPASATTLRRARRQLPRWRRKLPHRRTGVLHRETRIGGKFGGRKPPVDFFATKASRIIRAMLSDPANGWQVQRLARWESLGGQFGFGVPKRSKPSLSKASPWNATACSMFATQTTCSGSGRRTIDPRWNQSPLYVNGDPPEAEAVIAGMVSVE
jgi:hypothetical protein